MTKTLKVIVIIVGALAGIILNLALRGGNSGPMNPIILIATIAFIGAVWKWKPKSEKGNDNHTLDKR